MKKKEKLAFLEAAKWTLIASLLGVILSVSFNSLLAYVTEPPIVGAVLAFIALGSLISQFLQFGFQTSVVRIISRYLAKKKDHDASVVAKRIIHLISLNAIVALVFLLLSSYLYQPQNMNFFDTKNYALIPVLLIAFSFSFGLRTVMANIDRAFGFNAQATFIGTLLPSLLQLLFLGGVTIAMPIPTTLEIIFVFVSAHVLSSIVCLKYTWSHLLPSESQVRNSNKSLYQSGLVFFANGFVFSFFSQLGVLYLQHLNAYQEVAVYGVPSRLMITIAVPVVMLMQYLSPYISKNLTEGNFDGVSKIVKMSSTICFLYHFILLAFFYYYGERTLSLMFGNFYAKSNDIILVLLIGNMISFIFGFGIKTIEMSKYYHLSFIPGVIAILISIFMMPFAFEAFGTVGVALSISMGMILSRVIGFILALKYLHIRTWGFVNVLETINVILRKNK